MKTIFIKALTPFIVASGLFAVGLIAAVKMIEERHDDDYFWE